MTAEPAQEGVDPGVPGTTQDVAWRRWGGGHGVPLVVLHGVTDDSGCWTPLAAGWSRGRTVIGVDARGHGATPLGDEGFTIAALARDVAAVVRAELAAGPAVVLGHSMGALVAQELALAEPDLVNSLVLEDPAWRRDRGATGSGCPEHVAEFVRANASRTLGDLIDLAPAWPPGEVEPWALAKQRVDPRLLEVTL
ncbi:MAG TPA: alpha/beta fold hydrolase, partial [Actinotalea sp.]|nr:alpha/beta fold hydrolase [Actinotalea sp.]